MDGYTIIESEDEDFSYEDDESLSNILDSNSQSSYYSGMYVDFENIKLGGTLENKYKYAIENKVPYKFVFEINDKLSTLNAKLKDKDLKLSYRLYGKAYNISPNNFLLLYYISNQDMIPEELIDQLNKLENLTSVHYDYILYDTYVKKFEESYKKLLENDKLDYEKIKTYYDSFANLDNSFNLSEAYSTIEFEKTCVTFIVKDEDYTLDIDFGSLMFDSINLNSSFVYAQYNSFDSNYYKINDNEDNLNNTIKLFEEQFEEINKIYLIYKLNLIKKIIPTLLILDLDKSTLNFTYPANYKEKILKDLKTIFPSMEYNNEKIDYFNGKVNITIDNFDELRLYYLINTDPIVSKVLFLNENTNPRSLQNKVKYYYKLYDKTRGGKRWILYFYIDKIFDNKYEITFSSKSGNKDSVGEFLTILSKLFYHYNNVNLQDSSYDLVSLPYEEGKGKGLGGTEVVNLDEDRLFKNKKIDNLLLKAPKVFPRREYGRSCGCPKQPIIIDKEDVSDWENYTVDGKKRNVLLFPPENSTQSGAKQYYVCPGENSVLSFIKNPDPDSEYPIIPCCTNVKTKEFLYNDYDKIRENAQDYFSQLEEAKVKIGTYLKTQKILSVKQHGNVPEDLNVFLEKIYKNNNFLRMGVYQNSTSSFIHCLMLGSSHLEKLKITNEDQKIKNSNLVQFRNSYIKESLVNKEKLIRVFRKNIFNFCYPEICLQENSTVDVEKVRENVDDVLEIFSSEKYIRVLEEIFKVNIFVFKEDPEDKNTTILEKPNHINYHIRNINHNLTNILVYKHQTQNVYELIRPASTSGKKSEGFLFNDKVSRQLEKVINKSGYYVYDEDQIRKNEYSYTNWTLLLKDYQIYNQSINSFGRTYMITIKKKDQFISLFVPPCAPLNVSYSTKTFSTTTEICTSIFGKNYTRGSEGLWYEINGMLSLFVPCQDVRKLKNFVCLEYLLNVEKNLLDRQLAEISIIRKNSLIVKQLILWLWNLSPLEDVEIWFAKYATVTENDRLNQIFKNVNINIDYKFPAFIKTTDQGLEYLGAIMPYMFTNNTIFLYEQLYDHLLQYIKNYTISTEGLPKVPYKSIINIFNNETDFKKYPYNKVILGKNNFDDWINNLEVNQIDPLILDESRSKISVVFPYIDKKKNMFFVQNTESCMLSVSILISTFWKQANYNCGYDLTMNNVWSVFLKYPEMLSYFEVDVLNLAKKKLDLETEDEIVALEALLKELVGFELLDKFKNYKVYSSNGINDKHVKNSDYLYLWMYENGSYSSMLPII